MNGNDWHHIEALAKYYAKHVPPGATALGWQVVKLMEEMGEVAQSFIGYSGQNPRKGDIYVPAEDVVKELCDVIITGMVALATAANHPETELNHRFQVIKERTEAAVMFQ